MLVTPLVSCLLWMQRQSVADATSYGSEPDALQLLRPTRSAERGVTEQHYLRLRSRAEVEVLARDAGMRMSAQEFGRVFEAAAAADGERGFCCLVSLCSDASACGREFGACWLSMGAGDLQTWF